MSTDMIFGLIIGMVIGTMGTIGSLWVYYQVQLLIKEKHDRAADRQAKLIGELHVQEWIGGTEEEWNRAATEAVIRTWRDGDPII